MTQPLVVDAGTGDTVWLAGLGVTFKVSSADTGGAFALVEHPVAPGVFAPPHVHHHEDECTYVLRGTVTVRVGGQETVAGAGSIVYKPRGIPHAFWNAGDEPAQLLELITPGGFEGYFAEAAALAPDGGPPDMEAVGALAERYGLEVVRGDLLSEAMAATPAGAPPDLDALVEVFRRMDAP